MRLVCAQVVFVVAMIFTASSKGVLPQRRRPKPASTTQRCSGEDAASWKNSCVSRSSWNIRVSRFRRKALAASLCGPPRTESPPRSDRISRSYVRPLRVSGRLRTPDWRDQRNGARRYQPCDVTVAEN